MNSRRDMRLQLSDWDEVSETDASLFGLDIAFPDSRTNPSPARIYSIIIRSRPFQVSTVHELS
jgi:hypothetical protein